MTFDYIIKHSLLISILVTGCWAPEVQPPEKKKSPAELAGLAISSASASPTLEHDSTSPPSDKIREVSIPETIKTSTIPSENIITDVSYPFKGILTGTSVPLLGHGGGEILQIQTDSTSNIEIEVLEKRNDRYRVICKNCNKQFPFQAGWIDSEFIEPS